MSDHMDNKLRELTYRLIAMAPEAPPFPEESMVQIKPSPVPAPARRRSPLVWVAAAAVIALVVVGVPLFLFRGGDTTPTLPPASVTTLPDVTPTTAVPVAELPFDVTLYFLADYVEGSNVPGPHLVPMRRQVTASVAGGDIAAGDQLSAAINALIAGPTSEDDAYASEVSSAIPEDTELLGLIVDQTGADPRIVLDFNQAFQSGGGTFSMTARLAQVVYTATQFGLPSVEFTIEGDPVDVFSSEGIVLDGPQTRDDYRDILPLIFVEQPLPGDVVTSPIEIVGVSNTFEATLQYRVELDGGDVLAEGFATASCGSGCWGDFTILPAYGLPGPAAGYVVLYESSAEDGREINIVRIPVRLEAATVSGAAPQIVAIEGVVPGMTVVEPAVTIAVTATSIDSASIDGSPVDDWVVTTSEGVDTYFFTAEVILDPGLNTIEVALGGGGATAAETIELIYLPDAERQIAYLTQVSGGQIIADYLQWLTGDEANQAAFEDGFIGSVEEGVPNDYYIRDVNAQLRTLPVADDAFVILQSPATGPVSAVAASTDEWLSLFKADGTPWNYEVDQVPDWPEPHFGYFGAGTVNAPYWLYVDADGTVIQIEQQYIP